MVKQLSDEEVLLTVDSQKESSTFLAEVEKVEAVKKQLLEKKRIAGTEIVRLKREHAQLDKENIFETDQVKIRELAQKKKDIRYEIEEYESIQTTMYKDIIKEMLAGIKNYVDSAQKEKSKFDNQLVIKERQYIEERNAYNKAMQEKIDNLNQINYKHAFTQAMNRYEIMIMDKGEW